MNESLETTPAQKFLGWADMRDMLIVSALGGVLAFTTVGRVEKRAAGQSVQPEAKPLSDPILSNPLILGLPQMGIPHRVHVKPAPPSQPRI